MPDKQQPNEKVVEAAGLTKIFKDFWGRPKAAAVNGIEFALQQGQVLGFLGPNGSGKSTTVKMMLGLLYPTSGVLRVFDRDPTTVDTKARIGYLPEETYLYKYLTAAETLDFFGALFNLPPAERRSRTDKLLDMVGLTHARNRPVGEFSKGMARRIGLAQALINDPDLIILDEPTSGLDPLGCQMVKNVIREMAGRRKTIVLCSHLLADVEDVCDQVLIMYGGRIRARGSLHDLLTVEDKTRIVAPALTPDQVARVMAILNESAPAEEVQVDAPSMSLEDFFMQVVRQARAEGGREASAGVDSEGRIASFLMGDEEERGRRKLEALAAPEPEEPEEPETPEEEPEPEVEPDVERLATLAAEEEAPETPEEAAAAEAKEALSPEEKARRNARLAQLLDQDGGDEESEQP